MLKKMPIRVEKQAGLGPGGHFYLSDCRKVLPTLSENSVELSYLDPPFFTGKKFEQFSDQWDQDTYVQLLRDTFTQLHRVLKEDGSLYTHVDYRASAITRLLLDDTFGKDQFLNEIIWTYQTGGRAQKYFSRKHDTIFYYAKGDTHTFNLTAIGEKRMTARSNHMKINRDEDGRIFRSIRTNGREYRYYEDELVPPSDVWTDISHLQQRDPERTGYNTQKPLKLLRRIILASSNAQNTVLDPFCGSGTTLKAAQLLGRKFIGIDSSVQALVHTQDRLQGILLDIHLSEDLPECPVPQVESVTDGLGIRIRLLTPCERWAAGCRQGDTFYLQQLGQAEEPLFLLPSGGVPCIRVTTKDTVAYYDLTEETD
ncbi:MAG: hypothetical protein II781_05035 [Clostridia bacterium]|nr:hypothetical protein [Clostridia bacterium]